MKRWVQILICIAGSLLLYGIGSLLGAAMGVVYVASAIWGFGVAVIFPTRVKL